MRVTDTVVDLQDFPEIFRATAVASVDSGQTYREGAPVIVSVRRRGARVEIEDDGSAVALAGRPAGWLDRAEHVVAEDGFNVNRRGIVFVPTLAHRDLVDLVDRLGHLLPSALSDSARPGAVMDPMTGDGEKRLRLRYAGTCRDSSARQP